MKGIGIIIKELRKEIGCTQSKLAEVLGITQDSVSLWENDKRIPDTPYIILMAEFFDVSTDYLLGLSGEYKRIHADGVQEYVTAEELQRLREYRKLPAEKKRLLDEYIKVLLK